MLTKQEAHEKEKQIIDLTIRYINDVGPLLGRLAALCDEHREEAISPQQWNAAISVALTGHAPRGLH